jgi:Flp pilus assembly protein TadG
VRRTLAGAAAVCHRGGARLWRGTRNGASAVGAAARARWRAAGAERGVSTVELAVLAPALMMVCMLIIQFGLWFNARQAAVAAAQAGAAVARQEAATSAQWRSAAQTAATRYYRELNTKLLGGLTAVASGNRAANVYVTVRGPLGYSVFPFFGLHLTVSATAGGPVECFRPANANGRC